MRPEFYFPEKVEKCWADDPYMLEKTKFYGDQAREFGESLVRANMQHHPWVDNDNSRWLPRLRLFDLEEDSSLRSSDDQPQQFESARDLYSFLKEARTARENSKRQKHLFILEDIDPRFAEVLGVMLGIPAAFFMGHCDKNVNLRIMDRKYVKIRSSRYWKITVPRRRTAKDLPDGTFTIFAGNYIRRVEINNKWNPLDMYSPVSYWGQDHGEDSWTAVIVVDPWQVYALPADDILRDPSEAALYLSQVGEYNNRWVSSSIVVNRTTSYAVMLQKESMFDFLLEAHERSSHECSLGPFSATAYARILWVRSGRNIYPMKFKL